MSKKGGVIEQYLLRTREVLTTNCRDLSNFTTDLPLSTIVVAFPSILF